MRPVKIPRLTPVLAEAMLSDPLKAPWHLVISGNHHLEEEDGYQRRWQAVRESDLRESRASNGREA